MLVEFDERTGRHDYAPLKECHYMRKAIAVGEAEHLRILVCAFPSFLYYVAAELNNCQGRVTTCWVHEDGIESERAEKRDEPDHPVHGITCMSDIFRRNEEIGEKERSELGTLLRSLMDRADGTAKDVLEQKGQAEEKKGKAKEKGEGGASRQK